MDSQEPLFLINGVNYTKLHNACQYRENPRNRDSHKAVPIAVPTHRLIATEVTLGTPTTTKADDLADSQTHSPLPITKRTRHFCRVRLPFKYLAPSYFCSGITTLKNLALPSALTFIPTVPS